MRITSEQCNEVIEIVERIREHIGTIYDLDRRLGDAERYDGFRSSLRPMEGSKATVVDEDGVPMPDLSDPVGEAVVSMLAGDRRPSTVREDVKLLNATFAEIRGLARMADGARDRAMLPDDKTLDPECCEVHKRHEFGVEPLHRSGRCRWCYDFWLAEGVDPPLPLLKARAEGRRITQQMVMDSLRHQPKAKRRKRRAG